jgi:NAD(P)-dependent dehydrogenase (short-subunit alcohol dehydrogenase family)
MHTFHTPVEGKVGLLTGGTSGFGYEMVQALLQQGANLAVFSVDELSDADLAKIRKIDTGNVEFYTQDIMAAGASQKMVEQTVERFGKLDFVIVNAGFALRVEESLLNVSLDKLAEDMRTQFEVFPIAFATLALAAARVIAPRYAAVAPDPDTEHRPDSGAIVVTLSETSLCPLRDDMLAYGAAKRACLAIMQSLAATLGPQNIRVNGIAPGFANTARPRQFYSRHPQIKADIDAKAHLKPAFMHPGAVVPAVLYLLTDNYVTGEVIALDGGYNIQLNRYFQDT